jgi:uncharacterized iron-regulated protein
MVWGVLLSSCAVQPAADGSYRVHRPFRDFYDTAFILTNAGKTPPREITLAEAAAELSRYDVVFFGENHGHPGVHLQEMKLLRALVERNPRWVLSFEQFERDVQPVLDDYLAGRIGETTLIDKGRAWNNYAASYRPLMQFAKDHGLPVIAAEAPGWAITCIAQEGVEVLDRFTPPERSWVAADLHVGPGAYRHKFMEFLGESPSHGGGSAGTPEAAAKASRSFAAQAARDDTMAESIDMALRNHPGYHLLHVTGSFHAAGFLGTVERLRLREPQLKIAVIDPVEAKDPAAPAIDVGQFREGTVLQLIHPNPEAFADGEDMSAALARMTHAHETNHCKYSPPVALPAAPAAGSTPKPVP